MKTIILLLLVSLNAFADFKPGTMSFRDGTSQQGFIEVPDDSENSKIRFRKEEKGKTEKFPLELIQSFVITNNKGQTVKFAITHLAYFKPFSKGTAITIHKKWACVQVLKEGKINLYTAWYLTAGAGGGAVGGATISGGSLTTGDMYINRPGEDHALEFYSGDPSGFSITIGSWKYFTSQVEKHFGKECPELVQKIDKDDFKKNGYKRIVELYEQYCGR